MNPNLMTFIVHALDDRFITSNVLTNHKEGRLGTIFLKDIQSLRCCLRIWTVIKGQSNHLHMLLSFKTLISCQVIASQIVRIDLVIKARQRNINAG